MILVVGGTKEGEKIFELLKRKNSYQNIKVNLKSKHGEKVINGVVFLPRYLNCPMTTHLIRRYNVKALIDATPVYFKKASLRIISACKMTKTRYIRFEKPAAFSGKSRLIYQVEGIEEAASKATDFGKVIFLDIGNNNINIFTEKARERNKEIVARISEQGGLTNCLRLGINPHNILFIEGPFSKEFNLSLIREYDISVFVTRDLGQGSDTTTQIEAALEEKIPLILIERPPLNYSECVNGCEELLEKIGLVCQN
jgi:precorrin-6A/cobalt-precorrin-6A reductase